MLIDEPKDKRSWMMDYCKANNLSPCDEWAWEEASEAWEDVFKAQEYKPEHKFERPLSVWLFTIILMTTMISFLYSMVYLC